MKFSQEQISKIDTENLFSHIKDNEKIIASMGLDPDCEQDIEKIAPPIQAFFARYDLGGPYCVKKTLELAARVGLDFFESQKDKNFLGIIDKPTIPDQIRIRRFLEQVNNSYV